MTIGATTRRSATALASDADVTTLSAVVPRGDLTIPVDEPLGSMLPDGGLQRGSIVGCEGPAAVSLAAAMVAGAARAGSWVLLLGIPMVGLEAFDELGVSLRRVVSVEAGVGPAGWAEGVALWLYRLSKD